MCSWKDPVRTWREGGTWIPGTEASGESGPARAGTSLFWRKERSVFQAAQSVVRGRGSPSKPTHRALMKVNQFCENCELATPSETDSWCHPGWSPRQSGAGTQPPHLTDQSPSIPLLDRAQVLTSHVPGHFSNSAVSSSGGLAGGRGQAPGPGAPRGQGGRLLGASASLQAAHCRLRLPWRIQA